jgi:two-component system sensor histidine kinase KdpD
VLLLRQAIEGHVATIQLIYLLGVLLVAVLVGTGPAFVAALLSFVYASYFVVEPRYTFSMADPEQAVRLIAFLTVALLAGELAARAYLGRSGRHCRGRRCSLRCIAHTNLTPSLQQ